MPNIPNDLVLLCKMSRQVCFLSILFYLFVNGYSERILAIFPTPSVSHQVVFRPLIQELVSRGHEVEVITTDPIYPEGKAPRNLTEIDVHDLSYEYWSEFVNTATGQKSNINNVVLITFRLISQIFEKQILTYDVKKIIKRPSDYYDLLIVESWVRPAYVFTHLFKAPAILISSIGPYLGLYETMGAAGHPLLYPNMLSQRLYNLTFVEKVSELYKYYNHLKTFNMLEAEENKMIERNFGRNVPPLSELTKNFDLYMKNMHPLLENNQPTPPGIVHIWGIYRKPEKQLPSDLASYLDSSKHGVIYMSFGTNASPSALGAEKIQIFLKALSQLPYDILWKWDKDELPGKSNNIRIGKWFPQSDLLRHPKIKLFITQGGLQSTDEAITAKVPLMGIPMLGDQWYNTEKYEHFNIGKTLSMETITVDSLRNTIEAVIGNDSYRRNIAKLKTLLEDQPEPALERAVWWTEHVMRHGGAHLRAAGAHISWSEYLMLDVVIPLLIIFILSLLLVSFAVFSIVRWIYAIFKSTSKLKEP